MPIRIRRSLPRGITLVVAALLLVVGCGSTPPARDTASRSTPVPTPTPVDPTPSGSPSPAPSPLATIPPGQASIRVPMLMYHYVRNCPNPNDRVGCGLSVSPAVFRQQMQYLADHGYHTVTMAQIRAYFHGKGCLPQKSVALTFDDGYQDFYTAAFPILREFNFTATQYVISGFIDDANQHSLRRWQIQELSIYGIDIGAHTFNHADLTKTPPGQMAAQLGPPKKTLEAITGAPVLDFAYPAGKHNASAEAEVAAAGYESAVTTEPGLSHNWGGRFIWNRQRVEGGQSMAYFAQSLEVSQSGNPGE